MLSRENIERYRRMSMEERFEETRELIRFAEEALALLPPEERRRRLAIISQQHRESNEALARGLAR